MSDKEMLARLLAVFNEVFKGQNVDENTTTATIENWDSLKQIELMIACEEEFDVRFSMQQMISAASVREILQILLEKKGNQ